MLERPRAGALDVAGAGGVRRRPMLFDATLQQGLEGIVSKRLTSRYGSASAARHWLKFAHRHRCSYVVGGWRPQEGTTRPAGRAAGRGADRRRAALPRPGRQRHRRRGQPGAHRRWSPLGRGDSPFADEVPRRRRDRHVLGGAGAGGRRRDPRAPGYSGCASRPTAASAPTCSPRTCDGGPADRRARLLAARALPLGARAGSGPATADAASLDGVRVRLPSGTTQVVTVNHTRGYHARVTFWRLDRRRSGWRGCRPPTAGSGTAAWCRHRAAAGHRHHAAGHLPAAVGVRHPAASATRWELDYREVRARRLLGAGQRVALLQPLPQQAPGRLPLVAADEPTRTAPSG